MPQGEPTVVTLARQWRAELIAGEKSALDVMARQWLAVEGELRTAYLDAAADAAQGSWTAADLRRQRRYLTLLAQTQEQLELYGAQVTQQVAARRVQAAVKAYANAKAAINAAAADAQVAVTFDSLPVGAVERMTALASQGPLAALLEDAAGAGADAVGRELVTGVAMGRAPADIARRMLRSGLGTTFTRASTIARTETLRSYRMATLDAYRASGVVVGYRRLAGHDRRSCLACLLADGEECGLGEDFAQHPCCRCVAVPVLANAPTPQWETGREWFARQGADVQREMLGARRYDLWQSGQVSLGDLVKRTDGGVWGPSLGARPLKELSASGQAVGVRSSRQASGGRATMGGQAKAQGAAQDGVQTGAAQTAAPSAKAPPPQASQPQAPQAAESAAPAWRPSMAQREADLWAKGSALPDEVYHVTDAENVTALKREGFDLTRSRFGRVWGNGVYVTPDEETADMYEAWAGGPTRRLTLRLNVQNPMRVDVSRARERDDLHEYILRRASAQHPKILPTYAKYQKNISQTYWDTIQQAQKAADNAPPSERRQVYGRMIQQAMADGRIPTGSPSSEALKRTLEEYGYDALYITESPLTGRVGGVQVVIFDPKKVVIVDEPY